ncbi:MAG: hypothetical protein JXA25_01530 [Anaerolineales bacterium]|nr:hypothetical protein [Anaerolineales bacterium]
MRSTGNVSWKNVCGSRNYSSTRYDLHTHGGQPVHKEWYVRYKEKLAEPADIPFGN